MMVISPSLEAYGSDARVSSLADALEIQALRSPSISLRGLADYIRDSNWTRLLKPRFRGPSEVGSDEDDRLPAEIEASEGFALEVFDLLREREDALGSEYPFRVDASKVWLRDGVATGHPYLLLLGLTVAHSYGLASNFDPTQNFEDLVAICLAQKGLVVGGLTSSRRKHTSFAGALEGVGRACALPATVTNSLYRRSAQDEGVDVVARFDWRDDRPFHWVYIVQATCGKSETWKRKMGEPSPSRWKDFLGQRVQPQAVLAVPHHIPRQTAFYLADHFGGERLLIDRLQLCQFDGDAGHLSWAADVSTLLESIEVNFS
jgi:hypothetical protein